MSIFFFWPFHSAAYSCQISKTFINNEFISDELIKMKVTILVTFLLFEPMRSCSGQVERSFLVLVEVLFDASRSFRGVDF